MYSELQAENKLGIIVGVIGKGLLMCTLCSQNIVQSEQKYNIEKMVHRLVIKRPI